VGEPDSTTFVVPVEVVTPVPPLATGKVPVTPVVSGRPVAFVRVTLVGVPNNGVTKVGEVLTTNVVPVPVCEAIEVAFPTDVITPVRFAFVTTVAALPTLVTPPVKLAFVVTLPAVKPAAVPEMFVPTSAVGVPRSGVISVGEVENTRLVEVVPVAPAAVKPDILLNAAIPALVAFVPPSATVTGAVSENTVPVSVSPVDAVYDPAPLNCDQGKAVVPSTPPAFAVQT
jgi:hypothetical protein